MSSDVGLVLLYPPDDLPPAARDLVRDPDWRSFDDGHLEHPGLGASLRVSATATGFTAVRVRIPARRFTGSDATAATACLQDLWEGAARTGAGLGWVSRYAHHLDDDWIEEHVLLPWLAEFFNDVVRPAWTAVFVGPALAGKLPRHPDWSTLHARDSGHVYLIDDDLNPFAEGVAP